MTDLTAFLQKQLTSTDGWNCSTMPSDWCIACGYSDFAASWRGVVQPSACDAAATEGGGLLALWVRDIGDGLPVTDEPKRGDIAVIEAIGMQAGAIFTGERWAIKGQRTLHFLASDQVAVLKAWRV